MPAHTPGSAVTVSPSTAVPTTLGAIVSAGGAATTTALVAVGSEAMP